MRPEFMTTDETINIGVSLGTVYEITVDCIINLYNYGYNPLKKEFYYNKHIHLPKNILKRFDGKYAHDFLIGEMKDIGIYHLEESEELIREYEESKAQTEFIKQKILTLRKRNMLKDKK